MMTEWKITKVFGTDKYHGYKKLRADETLHAGNVITTGLFNSKEEVRKFLEEQENEDKM